MTFVSYLDRWTARRLRAIGVAVVCAAMFGPPGAAQQASLDPPARVAPAAEFSIPWQGPDAPGDFIAIAAPDAAPTGFIAYARTSAGNPASMVAPEPGEYELRYVSASSMTLLARVALTVSAAPAPDALTAPPEAEAGAALTIAVADPGAPADYVTIVGSGEPDTAFGAYARLRGATEVDLPAPEQAGTYEVRLVRARDQTVLARAPLVVTAPDTPSEAPAAPSAAEPAATAPAPAATAAPAAPTATLMALAAVDSAASFHVAWTGPGAPGDRIEIAPEDGEPAGSAAQLGGSGAPAVLTAPGEAGQYRIRYVAGDGSILADRALEVR